MSFKFQPKKQEFLLSSVITFLISGLTITSNSLGFFQSLEWLVYDTWFRLRSETVCKKKIKKSKEIQV
jgi:CHASE2 domain-containing sensor protein